MKLGYHYHIPYIKVNGEIRVPLVFGIFVNELALNVAELHLFLFERKTKDLIYFDFVLNLENIFVYKLADEPKAYTKYFMAYYFVKPYASQISNCDFLLLRGPSPVNYAFKSFIGNKRIINLMVGDYSEGVKYLKQPLLRKFPIILLNYLMHRSYIKSLRGTYLVFNSELLREKYFSLGHDFTMMNTGVIRNKDLISFNPVKYPTDSIIHLLFVGRLDWAKGFKEMFEAIFELNNSNTNYRFTLDIVGGDDSSNRRIFKELRTFSKNVEDYVVFHGSKSFNDGLLDYYKNSDIFILPSYQEGFPRVIWEALAHGLPVVATKVGSIPYVIQNDVSGILIDSHNSAMLVDAVKRLVRDKSLYNRIRLNGWDLCKNNTLEFQTKALVKWIISKK